MPRVRARACADEGYLCCLGYIRCDSVDWAASGNPRGKSCGPCLCPCHGAALGEDHRGESERLTFDRVTGAPLLSLSSVGQ